MHKGWEDVVNDPQGSGCVFNVHEYICCKFVLAFKIHSFRNFITVPLKYCCFFHQIARTENRIIVTTGLPYEQVYIKKY